jgi:RNA polymerase sigma factor (sigma-70 family)
LTPRTRVAAVIRIDQPSDTAPTREATFAAALPWVRRVAIRLANRLPASAGFDADDLFQVGSLAAWDLAATWEPAASQFSTYAWKRVIGVMVDLVRGESACGFTRSGARARCASGDPIRVRHTLADTLGRCDPEIGDDDEAEFVELLKLTGAGFDARDRDATTRYFVRGCSMKQVSQETGVSESLVSQLIGGVVDRARESLRARGRTRYTAFA